MLAAFTAMIAGELAIGRPANLPARLIGRLTRRRLTALAEEPPALAIGAVVLMLPPLDAVPFGATVPAATLAARDGLVALPALIAAAGLLYLVTTLGAVLGRL